MHAAPEKSFAGWYAPTGHGAHKPGALLSFPTLPADICWWPALHPQLVPSSEVAYTEDASSMHLHTNREPCVGSV